MQIFKTLFLLGLVAIQSLGEPIPRPGSFISARDGLVPNQLSKRNDPPATHTDVSIGEVVREKVGETLYTEGLLTCIAVVVIGQKNVDAAAWDKIMAHISTNLCSDGDIPSLDDQLNDLFEMDTDTNTLVNRKAYILTAPDGDNAAQAAVNKYIMDKAVAHWGGNRTQRIDRDQSKVMQPGGSRLWTDGDRNTYWGADGTLIAPAI